MSTSNDDLRFQLYKATVHEALQQLRREFMISPESFLYEADLQARLFGLLFDKLKDAPSIGVVRGTYWEELRTGRNLEVNPVKAEYPDSVLFDIALLGASLDGRENAWNQPVRLAIELKLRQVNGGKQSYDEDLGKLKGHAARARRPFTGVVVVFCHRLDSETRRAWDEAGCKVNPAEFHVQDDGITCWAIAAS